MKPKITPDKPGIRGMSVDIGSLTPSRYSCLPQQEHRCHTQLHSQREKSRSIRITVKQGSQQAAEPADDDNDGEQAKAGSRRLDTWDCSQKQNPNTEQ
jgi:hypothetical protein